jgi:hypothetical protein
LAGATTLGNPSDNRLLDLFVDPAGQPDPVTGIISSATVDTAALETSIRKLAPFKGRGRFRRQSRGISAQL